MSILIQDTARNNLPGWTSRAVRAGAAQGAVLSPFSSPVTGNGYKVDASAVAARITNAGGEFWFDATTHALQMPQVGDFRYYDQWDLWSGKRGALDQEGDQRAHIRRVFDVQQGLSAPYLAPTVLLHSAQSQTSQRAIQLSTLAMEEAQGESVWISIVGDAHFWAARGELDAHIGLLDQLEPTGWFITVVRPQASVPVPAHADEVAGVMRTVYALSQDRPVIMGHGDLAGLPAIAAGASVLGTGWDIRQRVCAYSDYAARANAGDGGQWYQRPTLEVLLGDMKPNEYQVFRSQNLPYAEALTRGSLPSGPENAFRHHAGVLQLIMEELKALSGEARVRALQQRYARAEREWPQAQMESGCSVGGEPWIRAQMNGINQFIAEEGW